MPIVDAHPHIYSPDRKAYPTVPEPWEPGEPASAADLKLKMDVVGVDRAVFIQTSTFYGHDNRYIMDSAKEHASWACGVVTLSPDNPEHLDLLEKAVKTSNIRGMRGTTDSINRISSPNVYRLWTKAMSLGIPVNCMVMDDLDRVPEIERIAQDLGDLKIVIDHCFMLNTRHRTEETLLALERLAKLPNIYAKLTSGTHGSYRVYPHVDMHGPLKRVIAAFGPDRCVWGSNFPNALWSRGDTYAQNLHLFVKELGLSLPDKSDILGGTAMTLWFPKEHAESDRKARAQKERTAREAVLAQEPDGDESVEDEENASPETVRAANVTNIADLLAKQKYTPIRTHEIGKPEVGDDELDVAALMDVANQLSAVLGPMDGPPAGKKSQAQQAKKPATAGKPDTGKKPATGPTAKPKAPAKEQPKVVNVADLLAAQNYTPIKTGVIGKSDAAGESGDGEFDISTLMNVADQLNAMLGSVEQLAADAADLGTDAAEDDRSEAS